MRLKELHARAEDRTTELGQQTADQAPDWAILALGPVPPAHDVLDRADWEHRAGLVAAHREAVGDTHPTRALDRMPGLTTTERRAGYAAAWHALGRPEPDLDEAAMPEGRLRIRVQAWDREQAWAPRYVDNHLRAAETDLQTARQAAALADARATQAERDGNHDHATQLRAEAVTHRDTADRKTTAVTGLTQQAQTYTAWATHTAATRHHAERARTVAEQRGLDLDTPATDVMTATDWLTHQHAADAAEDAHRPITETDLADNHPTSADHAWNTPAPRRTPPRNHQPPRSPHNRRAHDRTGGRQRRQQRRQRRDSSQTAAPQPRDATDSATKRRRPDGDDRDAESPENAPTVSRRQNRLRQHEPGDRRANQSQQHSRRRRNRTSPGPGSGTAANRWSGRCRSWSCWRPGRRWPWR